MLRIDEVYAGYETASVLRGASLSVGAGETVALLGRNGMGKSTLVRTVCGLTPPVLSAGSVTLDGERIDGLPSYVIARRGLGLVPQGRRIFGNLTVDENLRVVPDGGGGTWSADAVYELFPRLRERRRQRAGTLSGGEQQMLAIGRALMTNPKLLIMDEPSEGLAPTILDVIRQRLRELRSAGQAVLMAEQNVDLALDLADTVVVLGPAGRMAWEGTADELRTDPEPIHRHLGI